MRDIIKNFTFDLDADRATLNAHPVSIDLFYESGEVQFVCINGDQEFMAYEDALSGLLVCVRDGRFKSDTYTLREIITAADYAYDDLRLHELKESANAEAYVNQVQSQYNTGRL